MNLIISVPLNNSDDLCLFIYVHYAPDWSPPPPLFSVSCALNLINKNKSILRGLGAIVPSLNNPEKCVFIFKWLYY